MNMRDYPTVHS